WINPPRPAAFIVPFTFLIHTLLQLYSASASAVPQPVPLPTFNTPRPAGYICFFLCAGAAFASASLQCVGLGKGGELKERVGKQRPSIGQTIVLMYLIVFSGIMWLTLKLNGIDVELRAGHPSEF
ncbi:Hypothetical predicted protein, partial [Drosophila guanche]